MRLLPLLLLPAAIVIAAEPAAPAPAAAPKPAPRLTPGGKWPVHSMDRPQPRVVTPPGFSTADAAGAPPSDAIVLFDGKDLSKWAGRASKENPEDNAAKWKVENGYFEIVPGTGTIKTREKFAGDQQWHIEWATPSVVKGNSQGRGNSGVFIGGFPEVQVLDSFENPTYPDGSAAGLYGQYPPMVNASRKPGEWQTYDIIIERQRKNEKGEVEKKARISVIHNGVVVQWGRELNSGAQESDLTLQDHSNPVRYRNIWVRRINLDDPDSEGTPLPAKK
jgi:hypothetical protein